MTGRKAAKVTAAGLAVNVPASAAWTVWVDHEWWWVVFAVVLLVLMLGVLWATRGDDVGATVAPREEIGMAKERTFSWMRQRIETREVPEQVPAEARREADAKADK